MKHNAKITALIITMFLVTQLIGLVIVNYYSSDENQLPYGMSTPELKEQSEFNIYFSMIIFAFIIAVLLLLLMTRFKLEFFLKLWFFVVVIVALGISFYTLTKNSYLEKVIFGIPLTATVLAVLFAYFKIYKRNFFVHNFSELFIYPGIAAVFVPFLNVWTVVIFLILISAYDIWAVWHSGIMQKMAKYQINKLNIFSGFFIPYISRKVRQKLKKMKKSELKKKKIKIQIAVLGGGDVVFPIITAGVILATNSVKLPFGLPAFIGGLIPALFVIAGATLGLTFLLLTSKQKKFYPAMPFISAGIFIGMILSYLIF